MFEYLASGIPIIASDLSRLKEVIKEGYSGLLFRANHAEDLAEKISYLAMNKDLARNLGANAQKLFHEVYCWERQRLKILDLYAEVLG